MTITPSRTPRVRPQTPISKTKKPEDQAEAGKQPGAKKSGLDPAAKRPVLDAKKKAGARKKAAGQDALRRDQKMSSVRPPASDARAKRVAKMFPGGQATKAQFEKVASRNSHDDRQVQLKTKGLIKVDARFNGVLGGAARSFRVKWEPLDDTGKVKAGSNAKFSKLRTHGANFINRKNSTVLRAPGTNPHGYQATIQFVPIMAHNGTGAGAHFDFSRSK